MCGERLRWDLGFPRARQSGSLVALAANAGLPGQRARARDRLRQALDPAVPAAVKPPRLADDADPELIARVAQPLLSVTTVTEVTPPSPVSAPRP
ncbi:hypothetical protein [Nocardia gamkensis]|uniref:hypothetical protein n=1 Tax=Nocardia gamkensis TaxID=352869 RepID=UPI0037C76485